MTRLGNELLTALRLLCAECDVKPSLILLYVAVAADRVTTTNQRTDVSAGDAAADVSVDSDAECQSDVVADINGTFIVTPAGSDRLLTVDSLPSSVTRWQSRVADGSSHSAASGRCSSCPETQTVAVDVPITWWICQLLFTATRSSSR